MRTAAAGAAAAADAGISQIDGGESQGACQQGRDDGAAGAGWQLLGAANYLGVAGQGVSGLMVGGGFQPDFPGQLQAQVIGIVALILWGFISGLVVCAPLGLLLHHLQRSDQAAPAPHSQPGAPLIESDLTKPEVAQSSRSFR